MASITQVVEQCTGIAEVMASNSAQLFSLSMPGSTEAAKTSRLNHASKFYWPERFKKRRRLTLTGEGKGPRDVVKMDGRVFKCSA